MCGLSKNDIYRGTLLPIYAKGRSRLNHEYMKHVKLLLDLEGEVIHGLSK